MARVECPACEGQGEWACPSCGGTGIGRFGDPDTSKCHTCRGSGTKAQCGACQGDGEVEGCERCGSLGLTSMGGCDPCEGTGLADPSLATWEPDD